MAALSDEVKTYIVTALACFDSPKQVMADVKERFRVDVTSQQLSAYDPATVNGKRLSVRLTGLFNKTREDFTKNVSAIPIANVTVRLRMLDRMTRKAADAGNSKMAAALMEQAAKEVGGQYTNRRELTGPNGGAIALAGMMATPEQRDALISRSLEEF